MSSILEWQKAEKMLTAYIGNSKALKNPQGEILKGFAISESQIDNIIQNNPKVKGFIMMSAVKLEDVDKPEAEQSFTIVLAGTDKNGDIVENALLDFCVPCPNNCPNNYPSV